MSFKNTFNFYVKVLYLFHQISSLVPYSSCCQCFRVIFFLLHILWLVILICGNDTNLCTLFFFYPETLLDSFFNCNLFVDSFGFSIQKALSHLQINPALFPFPLLVECHVWSSDFILYQIRSHQSFREVIFKCLHFRKQFWQPAESVVNLKEGVSQEMLLLQSQDIASLTLGGGRKTRRAEISTRAT